MSKMVVPRMQVCSFCGAGPWHPREDTTYNKYTEETIKEAVWVCNNCGNTFDRGVLEIVPPVKK